MDNKINNNLYDNVKWVNDNKQFLSKDNPDATFAYVIRNHPNFGCASLEEDKLPKHESLPYLSKYADAVIVCCCEIIGVSHTARDHFTNALLLNAGSSIGGIAFIALHHSDANVRAFHANKVERWRRL